MKKKKEDIDIHVNSPDAENHDEIKTFIRKKNIQNKVLKEMIDKLKSDGREIKE